MENEMEWRRRKSEGVCADREVEKNKTLER
jgi:hypothetical protein